MPSRIRWAVPAVRSWGDSYSIRLGCHWLETDQRSRFRTLYEAHYGSVLAYALRRVDRAVAEDVVADTFLTAWRRVGELPEDPLPWLLGVARRVLANHRRGVGRQDAATGRLAILHRQHEEDPAEDVADRAEVVSAFRRLPQRDREVLALIAWEGLSADRAAAALGCSIGAFWVRLHRARSRLDRELRGMSHERIAQDPIDRRLQVDPG